MHPSLSAQRRLRALHLCCFTSLAAAGLGACSASTHAVESASMGLLRPLSMMEAQLDEPGPLRFEAVESATWEVPRSGVINLDHPAAAGLQDGPEPISIYTYVLRHPTHGTFLVDSGVSRALLEHPEAFASWPVRKGANLAAMAPRTTTEALLERLGAIDGVLLTHLHIDHVSGLPAVPKSVPVYSGEGEAAASRALHLVTRGAIDALVGDRGPLRELPVPGPEQALDFFGDGSLWVLGVPGHTPASLAFVARTEGGAVLITGDTCHTAFGWEHGVESGSYTMDQQAQRASLERLRVLAARHPELRVYLGHQPMADEKHSGNIFRARGERQHMMRPD